ncbi:MAG TPA: hypothetical protein VF543_20200 [Pyrinomonadaceae bacterium]|jgi:hypothetical protein
MRREYSRLFLALLLFTGSAANTLAQNTSATPAAAPPTSQTRQQQQRPATGFDLSEYGVRLQAEPRLIVMMAALDAAGFDPTPQGAEPSAFRAQVRRDLANLDEDLRRRLSSFYKTNQLRGNATPAEQAARYVSLAYAMGAVPGLDVPARSLDLPSGLLEVLDFAPLVREFYAKSGIAEQMPSYLRLYQAEAERLRAPTTEMVRSALSYLHTRPVTTTLERIPVKTQSSGDKKGNEQTRYTTRERERRFFIVPDLLAAQGTINFRVIGEDYYAIVPSDTNPASSELRRAYLQYVADPLIARFNREVAARRDALKQLLDGLAKNGRSVSGDVFYATARSLVAGTDARLSEAQKLEALARDTQRRLAGTKETAARDSIVKEAQAARAAIADETVAQLAEDYERGAVLAFYFADQLRGVESSGFDISSSLADMIASFDVTREAKRLEETSAARERAVAARKARRGESAGVPVEAGEATRRTLIKKLIEVDDMLRLRNYEGAEARLRALLQEYPGEPRIFFALGEAATQQARETTDEQLQVERLNRALSHYRMAVTASTAESDPAVLSRSRVAMGRILAFLDQTEEAMKEFDAAIKLGRVQGGAYDEAVAAKQKLAQQQ